MNFSQNTHMLRILESIFLASDSNSDQLDSLNCVGAYVTGGDNWWSFQYHATDLDYKLELFILIVSAATQKL